MSGFEVSDHAVLRWIERVAGIDIGAIRTRMKEDIAEAAVAAARAGLPGRYSVRTVDAVYVVEAGTIVTVLSPQMHLQARIGRGKRR